MTSYESTLSLARSMYLAETPRGIWEAEDEQLKYQYLRRARLRDHLDEDGSVPKQTLPPQHRPTSGRD